MAELSFSLDDFIVLFSSNFTNSSSVIASYFVFFSNFSKTAAETASDTKAAGTVAAAQQRLINFSEDEPRPGPAHQNCRG